MSFFDNLFKKDKPEPEKEIDRSAIPIYPMIKDADWQGMNLAAKQPFVTIDGHLKLALVFAQDAGDRCQYITMDDLQKPGIPENFERWQNNINEYPCEISLPQAFENRLITTSGKDFAAEKILSPAFLAEACRALNTDKLVISIARRRNLMITSYHEDFNFLEEFFWQHFRIWGKDKYGDEPITEMIFLANQHKVEYAVPLGFRLNLYEKDGQQKLSYSTMDDLFHGSEQIDFQRIMERNKIAVTVS